MSTRETLALPVDADLVRELDAIAKALGVSRHEAARVALSLGVEAMRQPKGAGRR